MIKATYVCTTLRQKCPNTEFFLVRVFPYSARIRENMGHNKLPIWILFTHSMTSLLPTYWTLLPLSYFYIYQTCCKSSEYWGDLVHFPAPSPKSKKTYPEKNSLHFSQNFFPLYFGMRLSKPNPKHQNFFLKKFLIFFRKMFSPHFRMTAHRALR